MIHADVLGERARLTPAKIALVEAASGRRFSYRELDERAFACARLWRHHCAVAKGDRVAILAHNRTEYLDAFFAAGKSGIILVPLGTRLTAPELAQIVADCGARVVLYDGALAKTVASLRQLVEVEYWIAFDEPLVATDTSYAAAVAEVSQAAFERPSIDGEDIYCLLYTSGTTGRPKGVMIPHRMVAWNGYNTVASWQLRADDVSPIFTPLYHAGGLFVFLVPLVTIGGTVILHRGFDADEIWRTIEREKATVVLGVPTIFEMLRQAPAFTEVDLGHLRWLISGGAPLPADLLAAYQRRGVIFKQGFGMTEVGVNGFAMTVEDSFRKPGSVGRPMMFTEVRLIDGGGRDVAVGEVGEMLFRGPHVSLGYWHAPEATAAALDDDGWFHSGDLGRCDEEGFFYIVGRQKDMIISGGVNIYPAEIEAQLLQHAAVTDAAVVGVDDAKWGEIGVAFVVLGDGGRASSAELIAHLEERLARYKLPREFVFIDQLPRTAYGKVRKDELRERFLSGVYAAARSQS